jgi:hypothetical protein
MQIRDFHKFVKIPNCEFFVNFANSDCKLACLFFKITDMGFHTFKQNITEIKALFL